MKLLQNSWSDMLVLDHIHQRLHNGLPDDTTLHNGQKFDLLGLGLLGVPTLADHFNELQNKLQELKFDVGDYICMKFLLLLNPGEDLNIVRTGLTAAISPLSNGVKLLKYFVLPPLFQPMFEV
jgi:hypothetical protein